MNLASPPTDVPMLDKSSNLTFGWSRWIWDMFHQITLSPADVPSAVTVGASPFIYQNTYDPNHDLTVLIQGGTVTKIEVSFDGTTYYDVGTIAGPIPLSWNHFIKITHAGAPNMTVLPR